MALPIIPNPVLREIICNSHWNVTQALNFVSRSLLDACSGLVDAYVEFTGIRQGTDERNRLAYLVEAKERPERPWNKE